MVSIDKNFLAARFGKASPSYEEVTPVQKKMTQSLFDQTLIRLKNKKVNSILEIGCGTGRLTKKLVEKFPNSKITAIDISPEMVAFSQSKYPQVNYILSDAETELFKLRDRFDLIISSATIQWFENPQETLKKAKNLLSDDGLLAISTFANETFCELSESFQNAYFTNKIDPKSHIVPMPSVKDWSKIIPNSEISDERVAQFFPTVRDFLKSIQNAGAVNSASSKAIITKSIFKDMSDYYLNNFLDQKSQKIQATYHSCYVFHQKTPV